MEPFTTLIVLAGSTMGLFALGSASKRPVGARGAPPHGPNARTYELDPNVPDALVSQLSAMLKSSRDPAALEQFAKEIENVYPKCARALRSRAQELLAAGLGRAPQGVVSPSPAPSSTMPPPAASPPPPAPNAVDTPPGPQVPQAAPPPGDAGVPGGIAPSSYPSLDAGMPKDWQDAVWGALMAESDPERLRDDAKLLQDHYPIAAGLLLSKALQLSSTSPTLTASWSPPAAATGQAPPSAPTTPTAQAAVPSPVVAPPPQASAPPPRMPSVPNLPTDAAGRNAGRPGGYPYITLQGEATYPAKLAREATGNEGNYPELTKINPQFARDGVHWVNIQRGDELNIPRAWKAKLAALYHITDPMDAGLAVVAPPPTSPPSTEATFTPSPVPTIAHVSLPPPVQLAGPSPVPIQPIPNAEPRPIAAQVTPIAFTSVAPQTASPPSAAAGDGGTYTVKSGDFPVKIAKALTGNGNRWPELVRANPNKKTKADGNFASLQPGEKLRIPAAWSTATVSSGALAATGGTHAANA